LLFTFKGMAQDPELFENTWYLENLNINSVDYSPPVNSEVDNVFLEFIEDGNDQFLYSEVCEAIQSSPLINFDDSSFTVSDFFILFGDCFLTETINFQSLYFEDFFPHGSSPYVFTYEITTDGSNKVLTITNALGDFAVYHNISLSNPSFIENKTIAYPSPVKDELRFSTQENILSITLYTIAGEKLHYVDKNLQVLDLSLIPSGIFLLEIETDRGTVIQKIVKE